MTDQRQVESRTAAAIRILGGTRGKIKIGDRFVRCRVGKRSGMLVPVGRRFKRMSPINPDDLRSTEI